MNAADALEFADAARLCKATHGDALALMSLASEVRKLRIAADKAAHALAHAQMWVDDDDTETEMIDAMRAVNAVLKPNA